MEINILKQDCDCKGECCSPTPKKWKKWLFFAIIVVATTIGTIKILGKDKIANEKCCDKHENCDKHEKCCDKHEKCCDKHEKCCDKNEKCCEKH